MFFKISARPIDVVFAITYRCNARCTMCNIWKVTEHNDLDPQHYSNIPNTLKHINISGGEPFLRIDLPEIVRQVSSRNPRAHLLISTNGFMPERVSELTAAAHRIHKNLGVGVSIDGIEDVHDRIRGIPGGFEKAMRTVELLKSKVGLSDIRIAYTLQDDNVDQLLPVYELSRLLGVEFTWVVAQTSSHYFQNESDAPGHWSGAAVLDGAALELIRRQLLSKRAKDWARAYFSYGNLLRAQGRPRPIRCRAGSRFFFVAPNGAVYACNVRDLYMGNIAEQPWEEIWRGERAESVREEVAKCQDNCWMVCTARTSMLESAPSVALWIAARKLAAHFGIQTATQEPEAPAPCQNDASQIEDAEAPEAVECAAHK